MAYSSGYKQRKLFPAIRRANGARRWGRRVKTAIVWGVLNFGLILMQPVYTLSPELCKLFMERSTWIAGLLIAGITGTDTVIEYIKGKNGGI